MSLASPYQEHYYVADGVTTSFSFGEYFTGLSQAYVKCIIYFDDGTNCVPTFTVDMTTGFITIVTLTKPDGTVLTVPPAGSIVRVFRDTPEQQNVTASQLQNYTAKQLERIFDSVVAMIQEVSYSDLHKTIRLTETQRDVSVEQLTEEKDQGILYWDFESRTIKATDYGQDEVVKSETVDRLLYLQPEGKIYFIPKGSTTPISIGSVSLHNDLGGRNAPDCHPESAITGLREHLQELRDKDIEIEEDVQIALNRSQEAKDTADEAKETAEYAQTVAGQAKDIAEDAKETAEGIEDIAEEAKEIAQDAKDIAEGVVEDIEAVEEGLANHIADKANPHEVTKAQVGLGNVDNTSDLDKPISTATQTALDLKMPISTKYGAALSLTINSTTYVVTAQLKDQDGNNLGAAQTIDLPLESVVVSGSYDTDTKEVILVLENGSEIRFSVADLISGLQSEITAQNPLDADLVNDSTSAHKFVSATEKTNWNNHIANTNNPHQVTKAQVGLSNVDNTSDLNKPISTATQTALDLKADKSTTYTKTETDTLLGAKQDTISDLSTIRSNAQAGKAASDTIATYGNIVTHNVSEFATAAQGAKADTAVQPGDLATVATTGDYDDLLNKPTIPTVNDATLTIQKNGTSVATFTANASSAVTANITVPTNTSDLINNSGFITSSDIPVTDVTVGGTSVVSAGVAVVPAIPTVNDATITITQGGITKGSFTLNQASGDTIALDAGGGSGTLAGLSDVSLSTPTDGQVLTYDNGDWINADITGGYHPDLFDVKWADHILNDVQWLRADTFSWQSGAVYQAAYQHLADDIDGKSLSSETVAGTTVQFYLADDGHKICPASEESNVAAIYTATGVAWYYILDTVNQRFKLPRTQFGVTGLRDTVGKYVEAGLPNITGFFDTGDRRTHIDHTSGAFYKATASSNQWASQSGIQGNTEGVGFDASLSNSIYGNSTTVQPKATQMYLYFYVGNFTQTALENTAGLNAELFNGKADTDLSNTPIATADYVVEKQDPTSSNGYTWFRKYKSGWVEQGGRTGAVNGVDATTRVNLPIAMSDANYAAYVTISRDTYGAYRDQFLVAYNRNATFFWVYSNWAGSGNASQNNYAQWLVCGMAA